MGGSRSGSGLEPTIPSFGAYFSTASKKDQHQKRIGWTRDKLIHQDFGAQLDRVWETASTVLPTFQEAVIDVIAEIKQPLNDRQESG